MGKCTIDTRQRTLCLGGVAYSNLCVLTELRPLRCLLHVSRFETSWEKPAGFGAGAAAAAATGGDSSAEEWVEMTTDDGQVYYENTKTGATAWAKPV